MIHHRLFHGLMHFYPQPRQLRFEVIIAVEIPQVLVQRSTQHQAFNMILKEGFLEFGFRKLKKFHLALGLSRREASTTMD